MITGALPFGLPRPPRPRRRDDGATHRIVGEAREEAGNNNAPQSTGPEAPGFWLSFARTGPQIAARFTANSSLTVIMVEKEQDTRQRQTGGRG